MSRKLIDKARRRLEAETGCRSNPWGGRLSVALVYPNTYHQAMSNLGFLAVYHQINGREDALAERFFLPDPEDLREHRKTGYPLFSLESGRPLTDFDLIAFSISFENDYLHLPVLFELGRLPLFAVERTADSPLVLCGGVCAFLNPEPLAEIMDLFAVGEAEPILPGLLRALTGHGGDRRSFLEKAASLPGIYVPSRYRVDYRPEGTVSAYRPEAGAPERVRRCWLADLDAHPTRSFVQTEETEFGDMSLVEISRGCSRGCRFCAAGFLYLPPRQRSLAALVDQVELGLCQRSKMGLVGAAVSDYPRIDELNRSILSRGGKVSVASLRIDSLTAEEVEALHDSGHRTVALAPEAGSQRMRDLINKGIDEETIVRAVELLGAGEILNLKLYFLIGLPGEEEKDIEAMIALIDRIRRIWLERGRELGRLGTVSVSVNPFIPKPFTPLQWAAMESEKGLKRKMQRLRSAVGRMPNTRIGIESLRAALLQAFLSRGDRRCGRVLPALAGGESLRSACRGEGIDPVLYVHRERDETEVFPWEVLDCGVERSYLWREYRRGLDGHFTPRCAPGCSRCGVCG